MLVVISQNVEVTAGPDQYGTFETTFSIGLSDYWNTDLANDVSVGTTYNFTGFVNHYYEIRLLTRDSADIA